MSTNTKVWIDKKGDTLRLRWMFEGKREQISLGVKDTPIGRSFADLKAKTIAHDIETNHYDATKEKYRPAKRNFKQKPEEEPDRITSSKLFDLYLVAVAKEKGFSPGTLRKYESMSAKLNKCLGDKPAREVSESIAKNVAAVMSETMTGRTIKTYLFLYRSCWDWAKVQYRLDINPWVECIDRVKVQPTKRLRPFSIAELQTIIEAFKHSDRYCHYTEFVLFLANTGCRVGEAAGIRWENLNDDYATAFICSSISRGHQKGTKTGKNRYIHLPEALIVMLHDRHDRLKPQRDALVFPSPKGLYFKRS